MGSFITERRRGFLAAGAIAQYARVKLSSAGVVETAGAEEDIGTADVACFAANDDCPVNLRTLQGTEKVIANSAIAVGTKVYGAAAGKVDDAQAADTFLRGITLQASAADGDVIEILPWFGEVVGT